LIAPFQKDATSSPTHHRSWQSKRSSTSSATPRKACDSRNTNALSAGDGITHRTFNMKKKNGIGIYSGGFWIRLFSIGVSVIDKSKYPPLFSERNGYCKVIRIGKWGIKLI
jgi:hypothetical protein